MQNFRGHRVSWVEEIEVDSGNNGFIRNKSMARTTAAAAGSSPFNRSMASGTLG